MGASWVFDTAGLGGHSSTERYGGTIAEGASDPKHEPNPNTQSGRGQAVQTTAPFLTAWLDLVRVFARVLAWCVRNTHSGDAKP
jgi:hypothetical protein